MSMTPCMSGKCLVKEHVVGSAAHANCIRADAEGRPYSGLSNVTSQATMSTPSAITQQSRAAQSFLQSMHANDAAENKRMNSITGVSTRGSRIKTLWNNIVRTQNQRTARANEEYSNSDLPVKVEKSFNDLIHVAQDSQRTELRGENIVPLRSLRPSSEHPVSYDGIVYKNGARSNPTIFAKEKDEFGYTRNLKIRYDDAGINGTGNILVTVMDDRQNELANEYYSSLDMIPLNGTRKRDQARSFMDLLIHVQNDSNWKGQVE